MNLDRLVVEFDRVLRTLHAPARSQRPLPGRNLADVDLDEAEKRHVVGLLRVDHCGEVCAQALYQGQALTSRNAAVCDALREAADEEVEHLAWTEQRIAELGVRKSLLNPVWYLGSLTLGITAGLLGDKWNLGFLAETAQHGVPLRALALVRGERGDGRDERGQRHGIRVTLRVCGGGRASTVETAAAE